MSERSSMTTTYSCAMYLRSTLGAGVARWAPLFNTLRYWADSSGNYSIRRKR